MTASSQNSPPNERDATGAPDYLKVLAAMTATSGDEFDLSQLLAGDRLRISTDKTTYLFRIVDPLMRDAVVESDRLDRPSGPCRIMGCTIGMSSSIKPNHLFCGGNLRFTHSAGERTHTTTAIRSIEWLRQSTATNP